MRIKILSSAVEDLCDGRVFYQRQGEEVGEYFFDSLSSDIDSQSSHRFCMRGPPRACPVGAKVQDQDPSAPPP